MKKFLFLFNFLLAFFLAQAEEQSVTVTKSSHFSSAPTSGYNTVSASDVTSGFDFVCRAFYNNAAGFQMNKETNYCVFMISGNSNNYTISKVDIVFTATVSGATISVYKSSEAYTEGSNAAGTKSNITGTTHIKDITPDGATNTIDINDKYFAFTHTGSNTVISSITIYYTTAPAGPTIEMSYGENPDVQLEVGTTIPTLPTLSVTTSDNVDVSSDITYSATTADGVNAVASVDNTGIVTVDNTKVGATTITATYNGSDYTGTTSASYTISVTLKVPVFQWVDATGAAVTAIQANVGETPTLPTLKTTYNGTEVTIPSITYTSDNEAVVAIENGLPVFKGAVGTATVTASLTGSDEYEDASASYTVTVSKIAISEFAFSTDAVSVDKKVTNPTDLPTLTVTPEAVKASVVYTSSDTSIATIDPSTGAVTLTGTIGQTTITAAISNHATYEDKSASYTLTVFDADASEATFDLTSASGYTTTGQVISSSSDPVSCTDQSIISFTTTANGSGNRLAYNSGDNLARFYGGAKITFTAIEGYLITKIVFTTINTFISGSSADVGTWDASSKTWEGVSQSVTITNGGTSGNTKISKIVVTYSVGDQRTKISTFAFDPATLEISKYATDFTLPTLSAKIAATDGSEQDIMSEIASEITYSVDPADSNIASIGADGKVVINTNTVGTATVTATFPDTNETYKGNSASYTVSVVKLNLNMSYGVELANVNIDEIGATTLPTLAITYPYEGAPTVTPTYTSSTPAVASVAADGTVTIKGITGSTIITAELTGSEDYNDVKAEYKIIVYDPNNMEATIDFTALGLTNNSDIVNTTFEDADHVVSVVFAKGEGSSVPKYTTDTEEMQTFYKNTMTVSVANDANSNIVRYISRIEIGTGDSTDAHAIYASTYTDKDLWIPSSGSWKNIFDDPHEVSSVTFSYYGETHFKTIKVYYSLFDKSKATIQAIYPGNSKTEKTMKVQAGSTVMFPEASLQSAVAVLAEAGIAAPSLDQFVINYEYYCLDNDSKPIENSVLISSYDATNHQFTTIVGQYGYIVVKATIALKAASGETTQVIRKANSLADYNLIEDNYTIKVVDELEAKGDFHWITDINELNADGEYIIVYMPSAGANWHDNSGTAIDEMVAVMSYGSDDNRFARVINIQSSLIPYREDLQVFKFEVATDYTPAAEDYYYTGNTKDGVANTLPYKLGSLKTLNNPVITETITEHPYVESQNGVNRYLYSQGTSTNTNHLGSKTENDETTKAVFQIVNKDEIYINFGEATRGRMLFNTVDPNDILKDIFSCYFKDRVVGEDIAGSNTSDVFKTIYLFGRNTGWQAFQVLSANVTVSKETKSDNTETNKLTMTVNCATSGDLIADSFILVANPGTANERVLATVSKENVLNELFSFELQYVPQYTADDKFYVYAVQSNERTAAHPALVNVIAPTLTVTPDDSGTMMYTALGTETGKGRIYAETNVTITGNEGYVTEISVSVPTGKAYDVAYTADATNSSFVVRTDTFLDNVPLKDNGDADLSNTTLYTEDVRTYKFDAVVRLPYIYDTTYSLTASTEQSAAAPRRAPTSEANGYLAETTLNQSTIMSAATTGVDDINVEQVADEAEYYNLQGIRVYGDLRPGIYIRRVGSTTTKILVK